MNKNNVNNKVYKKEIRGITLIALVITIIVLLILAGVSIAMLTGENGILNQANKAKQETEKAKNEELGLLGDYENLLENYTVSEEGFVEASSGDANSVGVNGPKLTSGMIAVRYDEGSKNWVKADESNKEKNWYDYSEANKKWANVVTVKENGSKSRKEYTNAEEGTVIPMEDITTMFVWIPRYSYEIPSKTGKVVNVSFLKGNTNKESNGSETTKIVHPGFKFGDVNLRGIWVAKFEASGVNEDGKVVGNASSSSGNPQNAVTENTVLQIKPSVPSWRHITVGESQYQSMKMSSNNSAYGWNNANSHMMKNAEWGAVAYLSYSSYGNVPMINGSGTLVSGSHWYDMKTGAGPKATNDEGWYNDFTEETHGYSSENGQLASTTHNIYGIYDMNGGAWERATTYLDNKNRNIDIYGNSSKVKYFENGEVKSEYKNYWEGYKVSEEERNNQIQIEGGEVLTQGQLWDTNKTDKKYQEARYRLTKANFDNMATYKGIGVNEVTDIFSFYAPYQPSSGNKTWSWFQTAEEATNAKGNYARTWGSDYVLIGHMDSPFIARGGYCYNGIAAGVLCSDITNGYASYIIGFRPVLAF